MMKKKEAAMKLLSVGVSPTTIKDIYVHSHDCYEIIVNIEGEGISVIDGKKMPFTVGTVRVIPPGIQHWKYSGEGFRDLYLHADELLMNEYARTKTVSFSETRTFSDDGTGTLASLMGILLSRSLVSGNIHEDRIAESLFEIIVRQLYEWAENDPLDPIVDALTKKIALSYSDPEYNITDALLATGYNKDYVRRRFQKVMRMTPGDYLTHIRISQAKNLLERRADLRLDYADIALMCGYYDERYFSRVFKKKIGMTPGEYERSLRSVLS